MKTKNLVRAEIFTAAEIEIDGRHDAQREYRNARKTAWFIYKQLGLPAIKKLTAPGALLNSPRSDGILSIAHLILKYK